MSVQFLRNEFAKAQVKRPLTARVQQRSQELKTLGAQRKWEAPLREVIKEHPNVFQVSDKPVLVPEVQRWVNQVDIKIETLDRRTFLLSVTGDCCGGSWQTREASLITSICLPIRCPCGCNHVFTQAQDNLYFLFGADLKFYVDFWEHGYKGHGYYYETINDYVPRRRAPKGQEAIKKLRELIEAGRVIDIDDLWRMLNP